jgi:hypothetical protein
VIPTGGCHLRVRRERLLGAVSGRRLTHPGLAGFPTPMTIHPGAGRDVPWTTWSHRSSHSLATSTRIASRTDANLSCSVKAVVRQCLWMCSASAVDDSRPAFSRLTARFSFSDLPDFLLIACLGDLSVIVDPSIWGPGRSRGLERTPRLHFGLQTNCGLVGNNPPAHMT